MINEQIEFIRNQINAARQVVITTHFNPDGDAIGSALALHHYLTARDAKSVVLIPNAFPGFLSYMKGAERILIYDEHTSKAHKLIEAADLIFCVDYNALNRLKALEKPVRNSTAPRILIDHHPEPEDAFDAKISRIEVSSTAELIYELIEDLGDIELINKTIAECIFTGIMTDTGSFSYSCNYPRTFSIVARLIEFGIDTEIIHQNVYDTFSEDRLRLLGYCLSEKLVVLKEYSTAYISLSDHDMKHFNFKSGDTEGVVNYALSIKGINFAVLFSERDDVIRISLRSKGDFSVNEFARTHFQGGGHKNAAGADSFMALDETIMHFVSILQSYKGSLQARAK